MSSKYYYSILFFFLGLNLYGQDTFLKSGDLQFGVNLNQNINLPEYEAGFGIGIQARICPIQWMNVELYSNMEHLDLGNVGNLKRNEFGIAGMVPLTNRKLSPFIFLGANYSNTQVTPVSFLFSDRENEIVSVSSLGVHGGVGAQYYLNERFNISISYRYLHVFDPPQYEIQSNDFGLYLNTSTATPQSMEHNKLMYLQFSMNYHITQLWK